MAFCNMPCPRSLSLAPMGLEFGGTCAGVAAQYQAIQRVDNDHVVRT
jgi:hypothetical protein